MAHSITSLAVHYGIVKKMKINFFTLKNQQYNNIVCCVPVKYIFSDLNGMLIKVFLLLLALMA